MRIYFCSLIFVLCSSFVSGSLLASLKNEPKSFRGFKWGSSVQHYKKSLHAHNDRGMQKRTYSRLRENLQLNGVKLLHVRYTFYKDRFYQVIVVTKGDNNKEKLLGYLKKRYGLGKAGPPASGRGTRVVRYWGGKNFDVTFYYTPQSKYSSFTIEYHALLRKLLPSSFKGLSRNGDVWYKKNLSTIINKPAKNTVGDGIEILKTRIDARKQNEYLIVYDPGPSYDPSYVIYLLSKGGKKRIGSISGEILYIPGNGNIYATGRANRAFNTRMKYRVNGSKFISIKQPMHYVGIKTETNKALKLYSTQSSEKVVVNLPKGTNVEILLNDGKSYLIKTPFGLVGWYNPSQSYHINNKNQAPLRELYIYGD